MIVRLSPVLQGAPFLGDAVGVGDVGQDLALDAAVEHAALLGAAATVYLFKVAVGGDRGQRPVVMAAHQCGQVATDRLGALFVAQALAIGRVGEENAAGRGQREVAQILPFEGDAPGKACLLNVAAGQLQRLRVDVRAGDVYGARLARLEQLARLVPRLAHGFLGHEAPALAGELAHQTRRAVQGDEGGLDQQRAGAAAGVVQGQRASPGGEQRQRGGQRLAQGGFAVPGAIAAAGERLTGGIQRDGDHVRVNRDVDLIDCAVLLEPVGAVGAPEPLDHRLLGDRLAVGRAHQRGAGAVGAHGKSAAQGNVVLPWQRLDLLEQLLDNTLLMLLC